MAAFGAPILPLALITLCGLPVACPAGPAPPPLRFQPPAPQWETQAASPDLRVRVPPGYTSRNGDRSCWSTAARPADSRWRNFCVYVVQGDHEGMRGRTGFDRSDAYCLKGYRSERTTIGGRAAAVERAHSWGGIGDEQDVRRITVTITMAPREWMVLDGSTGDDAGYAELLGIAATLTATRRATP